MVFLHKLKYLHVKNTVKKAMADNFQIFELKRITNTKKIQKIKNLKSASTCFDQLGRRQNFETHLFAYEAKQLEKTFQKFCAEIRNRRYKVRARTDLRVMLASLGQYLRVKDTPLFSIFQLQKRHWRKRQASLSTSFPSKSLTLQKHSPPKTKGC